MEDDDGFNDLSDKSKIIGIIIAALSTAILIHIFELGIPISVFVFLVIMVLVWIGSAIDNRKYKVSNNGI